MDIQEVIEAKTQEFLSSVRDGFEETGDVPATFLLISLVSPNTGVQELEEELGAYYLLMHDYDSPEEALLEVRKAAARSAAIAILVAILVADETKKPRPLVRGMRGPSHVMVRREIHGAGVRVWFAELLEDGLAGWEETCGHDEVGPFCELFSALEAN